MEINNEKFIILDIVRKDEKWRERDIEYLNEWYRTFHLVHWLLLWKLDHLVRTRRKS